jgi:hypothetical protein
MHLKDPLGKTIKLKQKNMQLIGVVKNFHFESMHAEIKPSFLQLVPHRGTIVASISSSNQQATINAIKNLYESYNPGFPSHLISWMKLTSNNMKVKQEYLCCQNILQD